MSSFFQPKGGPTTTTTTNKNESQTSPEWVQEAAKGTYGTALQQLMPYITGQKGPPIAGMTPDQLAAAGYARQGASNAFGQPGISIPGVSQMNGVAQANANTIPYAVQSNAAQTSGTAYKDFLNPYTSDVTDAFRTSANRDRDMNAARIKAQAAKAGAFGGGRSAIADAENTRNTDQQVQQMTAQLMMQGYDKATAAAQANTALRQQSDLYNAQAQNANNQFNTTQQNTIGLANAGAINSGRQFDASQANSYNLQSAGLQNTFQNDAATRQQNALRSLLGVGTLDQETQQKMQSFPLQALQMLYGMTPQDQSLTKTSTGTETKPNTAPSQFANMLGLGMWGMGQQIPGGGSVFGNIWSNLFRPNPISSATTL